MLVVGGAVAVISVLTGDEVGVEILEDAVVGPTGRAGRSVLAL